MNFDFHNNIFPFLLCGTLMVISGWLSISARRKSSTKNIFSALMLLSSGINIQILFISNLGTEQNRVAGEIFSVFIIIATLGFLVMSSAINISVQASNNDRKQPLKTTDNIR